MGTLTEETKALQARARLAIKNIPDWQKKMPGVGDALEILVATLGLLSDMAEAVEQITADDEGA